MFHSNIQSYLNVDGRLSITNRRQEHNTRREAFERVLNAKSAGGKPKATVYYANRQYTISL